MKLIFAFTALGLFPALAQADGITVDRAYSPVAPPAVMAHAAYMTISNSGDTERQLTGVMAEGYHMAHLHHTIEKDGVSSMAPMHQIAIAPGQSITLKPGAMHVMLMKPMGAKAVGDTIALTLTFANGEKLPVTATVMDRDENS